MLMFIGLRMHDAVKISRKTHNARQCSSLPLGTTVASGRSRRRATTATGTPSRNNPSEASGVFRRNNTGK